MKIYEGGDFHYHRADKLSTLHLYYGEREKANQIEEKLIPLDSYETWEGCYKNVV